MSVNAIGPAHAMGSDNNGSHNDSESLGASLPSYPHTFVWPFLLSPGMLLRDPTSTS